MFIDLLSEDIQPEKIDPKRIPEIHLSRTIKKEIEKLLLQETNSFVKVSDKTSVVQSNDKNYIFFSNQWLYLAVCCKKYAQALMTYTKFFDDNIRVNPELKRLLANKIYDDDAFITLLPDEEDRVRMIKFIEGGKNNLFRPGKNLINIRREKTTKETADEDDNESISDTVEETSEVAEESVTVKSETANENVQVRSSGDIFGSCVLKKLPVPDSSSSFLGHLIYFLAQDPTLYDLLETEVKKQIGNTSGIIKLSSVAKNCAKEIFDFIYKVDAFEKINPLLIKTGTNIKIDVDNSEVTLPSGNCLRYVFILPDSSMYDDNSSDSKARVFLDKEYSFCIGDEQISCRLTTEWKGTEIKTDSDGNYLEAILNIVNYYYQDEFEVKYELGDYYLYMYKDNFKFQDLPEIFHGDFSRRFITSLLAKPFVILTGNSGTGKTRIAKQFSEYLEKTFVDGSRNYAMIPVGADWTDNTKLLGFYNPLANEGMGEYIKTDIIRLIEQANENRNIPYFLILDEMNLSYVERYFSDFLSHMETEGSEFVLDGYPSKLSFPENLFVVGTVNIDETTYMFSPKVLDRANVIEFKPEKSAVLDLFINTADNGKIIPANDGSAEAFYKLAKEIRGGRCDMNSDMETVKEIFTSVYELVDKVGFEFAYRTVREIRQYISAAYAISDVDSTFDLMRAVDEQLLQKVLPKIHGNRKEIGGLLDEFENFC